MASAPLTGQEWSLVQAYLADVERSMAGTDPAERNEILTSLREHIDAALGQRQEVDAAAVAEVLKDLGSVESLVAAADQGGAAARTSADGWNPPVDGWPRSVALGTVVAGAAAVPLVVLSPLLGVFLALIVLGVAVVGFRQQGRRWRGLYVAGVVLAVTAIVVAVVGAIVLLAAGAAPEPEPGPLVEVSAPGG